SRKCDLLRRSAIKVLQHVLHKEQPFTCFRRFILPFKGWRIHPTEPVVVVQLFAAARPASSPCDASRPTPAVPDTGDASLA
ncbi:hypothetical protein A2U01_0092081, partial [Trifolium medium]|nr:hypothetical protein [Trifolium medium]